MEEYGGGDLLSEAMGSAARVVLVEDCVEAPGAFVLHLLLKRALASGGAAAFVALAQPFSHYDRVLRKMVRLAPSSPHWHFVEHVLCLPASCLTAYVSLTVTIACINCLAHLCPCHNEYDQLGIRVDPNW